MKPLWWEMRLLLYTVRRTTVDIDFMFRKTHVNLRKLKVLANELDAQILKAFYPLSDLYRVVNDDTGLQVDFMPVLHGIRSFESLRSDAIEVEFEGHKIKVASLEKFIRSKKHSGAPETRPSWKFWKKRSVKKRKIRRKELEALKQQSERNLIEQVRRQLALPMNRRTNFLCKRLPGGGSCL